MTLSFQVGELYIARTDQFLISSLSPYVTVSLKRGEIVLFLGELQRNNRDANSIFLFIRSNGSTCWTYLDLRLSFEIQNE